MRNGIAIRVPRALQRRPRAEWTDPPCEPLLVLGRAPIAGADRMPPPEPNEGEERKEGDEPPPPEPNEGDERNEGEGEEYERPPYDGDAPYDGEDRKLGLGVDRKLGLWLMPAPLDGPAE